MSGLRVLLAFSLCLCALFSGAAAASQTRPKAIVAQITQDSATLLYLIHLQQKTPLQNEKFLFDLSGANLWLPCLGVYKSSTFRPVRCRSALCSDKSTCTSFCYAPKFEPGCNNNTCAGYPTNNVPGFAVTGFGQLSLDVLALSATDGKSQGPKVQFSNFVFTCADQDSFLDGLPKGAAGSAGFNWEKLTLPAQLSSAFGFGRKFAVCLPGGNAPGAVFFGNGPYSFLPGKDVSQHLTYTPLLKSTLDSQVYYIGVRGIAVNEKKLPIDSARLKIKRGLQGTQLSSVIPYTQIATPIYTVIRDAFVKETEARNVTRVASVKPFDVCFDAKTVPSTRMGAGVPTIDLLLQNDKTFWRIWGSNSMVQVSDQVLCLAFVDGGSNQFSPSIVIGTHQMHDNLLQFDLATSRLGFTSSLNAFQTSCSNFNFTSSAL